MSKAVKVRIAVAVDADGAWFAYGAKNESDATVISEVQFECPGHIYWITAEIPTEPPTIEATVEAGDG